MRTITTSQSLDQLNARINGYSLAAESMALEADNFFKNAIEKIKEFFKQVWEWLKKVGKAIVLWFKRLWHNIKQLAKVAWNKIKFIGNKTAMVPFDKMYARLHAWNLLGKEVFGHIVALSMAPMKAEDKYSERVDGLRDKCNGIGKSANISMDESGRFMVDALLKEKNARNQTWVIGETWKKIDGAMTAQVKILDSMMDGLAKVIERGNKDIIKIKEDDGEDKKELLIGARAHVAAVRKFRTIVNSYKSASAKDYKYCETLGKQLAKNEVPAGLKAKTELDVVRKTIDSPDYGGTGNESLTGRRKSFLERDMDFQFV